VVLDDHGRSDFNMLQRPQGGRGGKETSRDANFMAFDVLYFDGHDYTRPELSRRRSLLELLCLLNGRARSACQRRLTLMALPCSPRLTSTDSRALSPRIRTACIGQVAAAIGSRSSACRAIVGYERSTSARAGIGSLLPAARRDNYLIYVGSVGTGLEEREARELRAMMDKTQQKSPPIEYAGRRKDRVWVQPTLIAEIQYCAWTGTASYGTLASGIVQCRIHLVGSVLVD
jgi:bifunctional non-homologous end joining protein LigD